MGDIVTIDQQDQSILTDDNGYFLILAKSTAVRATNRIDFGVSLVRACRFQLSTVGSSLSSLAMGRLASLSVTDCTVLILTPHQERAFT